MDLPVSWLLITIFSLPSNPTNIPSAAVSPVSSFVKWIKALLLFGECKDSSLVGVWFIPKFDPSKKVESTPAPKPTEQKEVLSESIDDDDDLPF